MSAILHFLLYHTYVSLFCSHFSNFIFFGISTTTSTLHHSHQFLFFLKHALCNIQSISCTLLHYFPEPFPLLIDIFHHWDVKNHYYFTTTQHLIFSIQSLRGPCMPILSKYYSVHSLQHPSRILYPPGTPSSIYNFQSNLTQKNCRTSLVVALLFCTQLLPIVFLAFFW